ncbi:hypothetical protein OHB35_16995 [Streptomyces phaeochromogenes]|uniref:Uncharacterized protein n=1 Tax=Streptomyces phaeochromogenes TaxID=1923 RepID=A0ABZ1H8B6_STRPH|nr:hypothetical protein [Streptomyces phaeochromogenes]WSD14806.1 hypothetical protein OHB35_16995 [Streptomyces phaeochromogenes]
MSSIALAIAFLLLVTLCYVSVCVASPFGACRKCNGFGFAVITDRKGRPKRGKNCRRCKGRGKRIRVGRWLYNRAAHTYRQGTH